MKKTLLLCAIATSVGANAQVKPKVAPEAPVDGKQYILVNKMQKPTQYMSRTGWDGAVYFQGETESKWQTHAFTAFNNGDGTWSFGIPSAEEEGFYDYVAFPEGSPNLNMKSTEKAMFKLDPKEDGFYHMILGEGNNYAALATAAGEGSETPTKDLRMHLNGNADFFVVNYYGGPFFGDIYGGISETEDESRGVIIFEANDSISFNWGFVSVDKVPAYYEDLKASGAINNFYRNYCSDEEYADGFLKTYQACADLYNSADYNEDDVEIINAMLNSKVDLYKEIEAAIKLNEDDNSILNAAIENAKKSFGEATEAAAVETATNTLKNAETAYLKGTGDVTAYGQNMSFEDLSAQDGNQSSSVAGAPAGWNIYINGKQVETASDVNSAGISAWHGVNNDAEGEIMDGQMAFGIWNGSIPQYEISQTISNLDNGTYEITAGLMAGSNGNGSRLTTQRIFGNLNSTYYASEGDYDLSQLDNNEVYGFAYNEILTTDREMRPVTVNAFVYDGTLTFGLRTNGNYAATFRTSGNGAGGDGWFKIDNFRIVNKGYVAADAVAIFNHYAEALEDYVGEKMQESIKDQVEASVSGNITEATPQDELIAAIIKTKDLAGTASASVKAYAKLLLAIETHYENLERYQSKAGIGDYSDAVMEAENAYADGEIGEEEIEKIIEGLDAALQECIQSGDIEEGADLTEYIKNPSFEDLSAQGGNNSNGVENVPTGWNLYVEGEPAQKVAGAGWAAINAGDNLTDIYNTNGDQVFNQYTDGEHLWGVWSGSIPELELSQTIKGLPAGTYTLTADIVVQNDWAGYNLTTQRLFANDYVTMFGAELDYIETLDDEFFALFPEDVIAASKIDAANPDATVKHLTYAGNYANENYGASGAPYTTKVVFGLAKPGDVTFGFRTNRVSAVTGQVESQASLGWFKLDNFRLTYDSMDIPAGAEATGIVAAPSTTTQEVQFYSTSGIRLSAPQKGINIVKMGDGRSYKVMMK